MYTCVINFGEKMHILYLRRKVKVINEGQVGLTDSMHSPSHSSGEG